VPQINVIHDGQPIIHLSWNVVGSDLAIVDALGRLSIFTVYISIDRLNCVRAAVMDQDDDLSPLVGFWWLNTDKPVKFPNLRRYEM